MQQGFTQIANFKIHPDRLIIHRKKILKKKQDSRKVCKNFQRGVNIVQKSYLISVCDLRDSAINKKKTSSYSVENYFFVLFLGKEGMQIY